MKLTSKFEAGADTSDIFHQLLDAMVDRVRRDLAITYTKFRDRVYKQKSYNPDLLWDTFEYGSRDLAVALRFLTEENIPDLARDKNSDVCKAVRKAHKVCDEVDNHGSTMPTEVLFGWYRRFGFHVVPYDEGFYVGYHRMGRNMV